MAGLARIVLHPEVVEPVLPRAEEVCPWECRGSAPALALEAEQGAMAKEELVAAPVADVKAMTLDHLEGCLG